MDIKSVRRDSLQRLVDARAAGNKAEFGRKYGIDPTYISQLLTGHRAMGEKAARKLEGLIGLESGYLDNPLNAGRTLEQAVPHIGSSVRAYDEIEELDKDDYFVVPKYDIKLSAGNGVSNVTWVVRDDEDQIAFRRNWYKKRGLHPENLKALTVRGRSMEPYLSDWDTVLVDTEDADIVDGEIYALVFRNQFYIKALEQSRGGLRVISKNPEFESFEVPENELGHLKILGRKVWRAG